MDDTTRAELETIRKRVKAATEGPWELETNEEYIAAEQKHYFQQWVMDSGGKRLFDADSSDLVLIDRDDEGTEYDLNAHNNLGLAAHARTDIPHLLAIIDEQEREVERLKKVNEQSAKTLKEDLGEKMARNVMR